MRHQVIALISAAFLTMSCSRARPRDPTAIKWEGPPPRFAINMTGTAVNETVRDDCVKIIRAHGGEVDPSASVTVSVRLMLLDPDSLTVTSAFRGQLVDERPPKGGLHVVCKHMLARAMEALRDEPASQAKADPPAGTSSSESESSGTCFAVSPNGDLVTAHHVVAGAKAIRVHLHDGRSSPAQVTSSAENIDVALLKVDLSTSSYVSLAKAASTKIGDRAFTLGYPVPDLLGAELKFTDGSISSLSGMQNDATLMQITVPVQPGNSGGPLMNEGGDVVGMITSSAAPAFFMKVTGTLPQGINWAVKAEFLAPLMPKAPPLKSASSRASAIERAKRAVCMVLVRR